MTSLFDACLAHKRATKYPDGYGFALTYLSDDLNPAHLRDTACLLVSKAYGIEGTVYERKDSDLIAFVAAYGNATSFEDYLIEAAQLCLSWAMAGDKDAINAMRLCGHPGY